MLETTSARRQAKLKIIIYVAVLLGIVAIDIATKEIVRRSFATGEINVVCLSQVSDRSAPCVYAVDVRFVQNFAGPWGWLGDRDLDADTVKATMTFFGFLTVVMLSSMALRTPSAQIGRHAAIALVLAGSIGNILDRMRLGYVVDFIAASWASSAGRSAFPAFNVADVSITVGVVILLVSVIRRPRALR